jgi:hypothetical protein
MGFKWGTAVGSCWEVMRLDAGLLTPIVLKDVDCRGNETSLLQCASSGFGAYTDLPHDYDACVVCRNGGFFDCC